MTFWEITRKDLILLARDARALFVLVAFPLLFITIIGLTTGQLLGWKSENQVLKIGVIDNMDYSSIVDEDDRQLARNMSAKIINRIGSGEGRRARVLRVDENYQTLLDDDELDAVLEIGPRFFERVKSLEPEDIANPKKGRLNEGLGGFDMSLHSNLKEDSSTRSTIQELLLYNTVETTAQYVFCMKITTSNIAINGEIQRRLNCRDLRREKIKVHLPDEKKTDSSSEPDKDNRVYQDLIPSYTVMFVFFLVNIMARSFLHERDLGTLRRLRMAPVSAASLVAGKTVPFLIISLIQSCLLFLCGRVLFGMDWGPTPWMLLPVILCTSLAATGLGLVVATLVKSESQVSAYANVVVITMAGISGCFMPRDWLPPQLQTISLGTPHAWSLMSYEQLLKNASPDFMVVVQNCGVLILFATAFFAFGCWRFRRVG
jgi:ABC-2 type transport system permease protein